MSPGREYPMTDSLSDRSAPPATHDPAPKGADVSRQQISTVAATLFCARGYAGTSLRDIGAAVGMKAGSLYYHFASKEDLAAEVLRIGVRKVHAAVVAAVDGQGPDANARSKLAAAMAAHLETLLDASDYTSAHIRCFPNVPETLRVHLGNDRRAYEKVWRALLDEAAKSDSLPSGMDPS